MRRAWRLLLLRLCVNKFARRLRNQLDLWMNRDVMLCWFVNSAFFRQTERERRLWTVRRTWAYTCFDIIIMLAFLLAIPTRLINKYIVVMRDLGFVDYWVCFFCIDERKINRYFFWNFKFSFDSYFSKFEVFFQIIFNRYFFATQKSQFLTRNHRKWLTLSKFAHVLNPHVYHIIIITNIT